MSDAGTAGGRVTITGTNFGVDSTLIIAMLNSQPCSNVTIDTDHYIINCDAPEGTGTDHPVILTVGDQTTYTTYSYAGNLSLALFDLVLIYRTAPSLSEATSSPTSGGAVNISGIKILLNQIEE